MSRERVPYLDVLRVLACLMVITMHAPKPNIGTSPFVLSSISLLMAPCIGLFFMVSGALLLPAKQPMKEFYKRRLGKIVIPTLVWTAFYLALRWIKQDISTAELFRCAISIPFSAQGHGFLWFMYTLTGLYLIAPIMSPWLEKASRKEIEFVLLLWGITLCYPLIKPIVAINESPTGILYSFSGYAGYFLLGYYLHRYRPRISTRYLILLVSIPVAIAVFFKLRRIPVDFYSVFWYLSILVVMIALAIFVLAQSACDRIELKNKRLLVLTSNLSFGIYLSHILFMRNIIWRIPCIDQFGGIIQILITIGLTFILSFFFSLLVSWFKFGCYIIGYNVG